MTRINRDLVNSCNLGLLERVKTLLKDDGADPNFTDNWGGTGLEYAIIRDYPEIVEVLLLNGANPNTPNRHGDTPLHTAVIAINWDIVEKLLHHGADKNIADKRDLTPSQTAHFYGFPNLAEFIEDFTPS